MKKMLSGLLLLISFHISIGQAGSLDNTFGNNGLVRTNIVGFKFANNCKKVLVLPDGSFYLLFQAVLHSQLNCASYIVHRFQNGALDSSFGEKGYSSPMFLLANTAAIQKDGKIVVAGSLVQPYYQNDFAVARLNLNGLLDSSFSGDGVQITDFGSATARINDIAIQTDGKIVATGTAPTFPSSSGYGIARYNMDGSLDNSFSGDGLQAVDFFGQGGEAFSIEIQPDGKILIGGTTYLNSTSVVGMMRFLLDGTPDNSFGSDGKMVVSGGIGPMGFRAMVLQSDGKIVLTGPGSAPGHFHEDIVVARLKTDGSRDSSFASAGLKFIDIGSTDNDPQDIVIQGDGKIIVGGSTRINQDPPLFAMARLLPNGNIDNSFSDDGYLTTRVGPIADFLLSMALQSDGKLLAAGWSALSTGLGYAVARFNPDGTLDNSLDSDGLLTDGMLMGETSFATSVVQPDGKIIAAGFTRIESHNHFAVVRYNMDGTLDNSFAQDGKLTIAFGAGDDQATGIALQTNGKIVVSGTAFNGSNKDFALARINPDGSFDNSFSGDGKFLFDFSGLDDNATALAIQPNGKIIVAGYSDNSMNTDFALACFNPNGTPDNNFGIQGKFLLDFGSLNDYGNAMLIQPDGKIVVAGATGNNSSSPFGSDFALARYSADGKLDSTFHGTGKIITDFFSGGDYAYGVALQADGKIIVAGASSTYPTYVYDVVVARYTPDGNLDISFSGDGLLTLDLGSTTELGKSVVVQPNGKIILGVGSDNVDYDFLLARLNPDGSFDNSFSGDGKILVDFGFGNDYLQSLSLHDNRVYAVGSSDYITSNGAIVALRIDGGIGITCPGNNVINTDPWICSAVVNNIDPTVMPNGALFTYTLSDATTGSGTGSASGLHFQSGLTNITYRLVNDPLASCGFTVTVNDKELPRAEYPFMQNICYNSSHNYQLPPLQIMDNCGLKKVDWKITGATTRNGTGTDASGHFNVGTNAIDWVVTDNSDNSIKLYSLVKVDGPLSVTIQDAYSIYPGGDLNTVYKGYNPAEFIWLIARPKVISGHFYDVNWSDGFRSIWNIVHPSAETTYTVTITDLAGCTATASKTIKMVDARCGPQMNKVLVCQSPGNQTCIDFWNVASYLSNGAHIGNCNGELLTSIQPKTEVKKEKAVGLQVYPNPTQEEFKLSFVSDSKEISDLIIRDQLGRPVETIRIKANQSISIGKSYRPGIYFAELRSQNKKYAAKLIKQ